MRRIKLIIPFSLQGEVGVDCEFAYGIYNIKVVDLFLVIKAILFEY
jgi:hypothetical protein